MVDPFVEVYRLVAPLRRSAAVADAWSSSPLVAAVTVLSLGLSLAGFVFALDGRGVTVALRSGVLLALLLLVVWASGPVIRMVERGRLSRLRRFASEDELLLERSRALQVPMSSVVRAFLIVHPPLRSGRPRAYIPEVLPPDDVQRVAAERLLRALDVREGGSELWRLLSALSVRAEVLSDQDVPVSVLLSALSGVPEDRSGLVYAFARMLASEVWGSVFDVAYRTVSSDLVSALQRLSALSPAQMDVLRSLQASWAGSLDELLSVSEHLGG